MEKEQEQKPLNENSSSDTTVENDEIKKRVEMARLPLMYLKCKRDPVNSKYDGTYERWSDPPAKFEVVVSGVNHDCEITAMDGFLVADVGLASQMVAPHFAKMADE